MRRGWPRQPSWSQRRSKGGATVMSQCVDVSDRECVVQLCADVYDRFGEVGVLLSNAGQHDCRRMACRSCLPIGSRTSSKAYGPTISTRPAPSQMGTPQEGISPRLRTLCAASGEMLGTPARIPVPRHPPRPHTHLGRPRLQTRSRCGCQRATLRAWSSTASMRAPPTLEPPQPTHLYRPAP